MNATVYTREAGPTVQLCGDSEVVSKWINGKNSGGQKYQEKCADSENIAPEVPIVGFWACGVPSGSGRRPRALYRAMMR